MAIWDSVGQAFGTVISGADALFGGPEHRERKMSRYQFDLSNQMAEKNYDRLVRLYNEIESPEAQLKYMRAAGFNPNMFPGGSSPSVATPSPASAPDVASIRQSETSKHQADIQNFINLSRQAAELSLLKSQKENVDADTKNKEADTAGKDIENTYKPEILQNTIKGQNVTIDLQQSAKDLNDAQKDKVVKETEVLDANLNNIKEQTELLKENKKMLTQEIKNLLQQYEQNKQRFEKELSEIDSRIAANKAQAAVAYATAKYYAAQTTGQNLENHRRELYNTIYEAVSNSEISSKKDQATITHLMLNMITNDNEIYDLKMPALRKVSPFMPYLDAGEKGIQVVNGAFDLGSKQIDLATKPIQFGKDIIGSMK